MPAALSLIKIELFMDLCDVGNALHTVKRAAHVDLYNGTLQDLQGVVSQSVSQSVFAGPLFGLQLVMSQ